MEADLEVFRELPGYKGILRAVLKSQIQILVEQLARETGEESIVLSASVTEGTLSHLGSESGKVFINSHDDFKRQFLGFCLKRKHKRKLEEGPGPCAKRLSPYSPGFPEIRHSSSPKTDFSLSRRKEYTDQSLNPLDKKHDELMLGTDLRKSIDARKEPPRSVEDENFLKIHNVYSYGGHVQTGSVGKDKPITSTRQVEEPVVVKVEQVDDERAGQEVEETGSNDNRLVHSGLASSESDDMSESGNQSYDYMVDQDGGRLYVWSPSQQSGKTFSSKRKQTLPSQIPKGLGSKTATIGYPVDINSVTALYRHSDHDIKFDRSENGQFSEMAETDNDNSPYGPDSDLGDPDQEKSWAGEYGEGFRPEFGSPSSSVPWETYKRCPKVPPVDGLLVSRGEGRFEKLIKCEICGKVCRTSNMARHKKRYCLGSSIHEFPHGSKLAGLPNNETAQNNIPEGMESLYRNNTDVEGSFVSPFVVKIEKTFNESP